MLRNTEYKTPLGHLTDTACRPDITAALEGHWYKGAVHWLFICLAGEKASVGESRSDQKQHAFSYLHYLLLARPDHYVAQGLLPSSLQQRQVTFLLGLAAKVYDNSMSNGTTKTLTSYYMRSYIACMSLATSQIHRISRPSSTKKTKARYTIKITYPGGTTEYRGCYSIYRSQLIHVFSPIHTSNLKTTISSFSKISFAELKDVLKN